MKINYTPAAARIAPHDAARSMDLCKSDVRHYVTASHQTEKLSELPKIKFAIPCRTVNAPATFHVDFSSGKDETALLFFGDSRNNSYICDAKVFQVRRMMSVQYADIFCACIICGFVPPCRVVNAPATSNLDFSSGKDETTFCLTV